MSLTNEPAVAPTDSRRRLIALAVGISVAAVAILWAFARASSGDAAGELVLEPAAAIGANPFTPNIARISSTGAAAAPAPSAPAQDRTVVQRVVGTSPGLYGGSGDQAICDPAALVAFLEANPAKASAWVAALNRDSTLTWSGGNQLQVSNIAAYVGELVSLVLRGDTRVTNHGFVNGRATPHQSVLQAGTAVLVDAKGTPRVRCACGNPLTRPTRLTNHVVRGPKWANYCASCLAEIVPAPAPVRSIEVIDIGSGGNLEIPFPTPPENSTDVTVDPVPDATGPGGPDEADQSPFPGTGLDDPRNFVPIFPSAQQAPAARPAPRADFTPAPASGADAPAPAPAPAPVGDNADQGDKRPPPAPAPAAPVREFRPPPTSPPTSPPAESPPATSKPKPKPSPIEDSPPTTARIG